MTIVHSRYNSSTDAILDPKGTSVDNITHPYVLEILGVPVGLPPNGTIAANGTLTLGSALPAIYSEGIWFYFPAGAVVGGSAGFYYCVMSSTTVGIVYTNYDAGVNYFMPKVPLTDFTSAVGSGVGYSTPTATIISMFRFTLQPGVLNKNGTLDTEIRGRINNSSFGKQVGMRVNLNNVYATTLSGSNNAFRNWGTIVAKGDSFLLGSGFTMVGLALDGMYKPSVDLTRSSVVDFTGNLPAADAGAAFIIYDNVRFVVYPGLLS